MNALSRFLADQQLWIVGLSLFILMVTVRSLVERIRRRRSSAVGAGLSQAGEGLIATSMVGLLSLLIAFTFSLALSRHELRRTLVVEEANAIGVAYMRAQLLQEPYRTDLSNVIVSYAQVRRATGELGGPSQLAAQEHSEALQPPMWQRTAAAARASNTPALAIFGYVAAGAHAHRRRIAWVLFMLVTLAFMLILDLDRPGDGLIRVSEANMTDMVKALPSFSVQDAGR